MGWCHKSPTLRVKSIAILTTRRRNWSSRFRRRSLSASNVAKPADPELLPYTIFAGTIIPAALQTGINTDLPGDVLATVTENVYDSVSGKNLLIPQGSKLLAKYSSAISFGQNRVQVAWQRLIRPDGVSLQMGNMNGVDPQGASGYAGSVDEHWWDYAKGIGLMLLFSVIDGQIQYSMKEANTQGATDVANSLTAALDQVGSQYTSNVMNIQPTITVKQGSKVQVFVNSDLIMPPANQKAVSKEIFNSKRGRRRSVKKAKSVLVVLAVMLSGCYLFSPKDTSPVTSVTVEPAYLTVGPGEQVTVNVTTDPPNAGGSVSWSIKDDYYAAVYGTNQVGLITGKHLGSTTLTATIGGKSSDVLCNIVPAGAAGSGGYITSTDTVILMAPGDSRNVSAQLVGGSDQDQSGIQWQVKDSSILDILGQGPNALITALKNGTTQITLSHPMSSTTFTISVRVDGSTKALQLSKSSFIMTPGDIQELDAAIAQRVLVGHVLDHVVGACGDGNGGQFSYHHG